VNGGGKLATKSVIVKDFAPLVKLADKINFDKLKQPQNVGDVNVSFKIANGTITVDPFTVKLIDGMPMKVSGYTTLDQAINYNVEMDVPMTMFPSGAMQQANTWIGELNKKLGSNLSVGSKVNVIAVITGTITDPKVNVTSKALGEDVPTTFNRFLALLTTFGCFQAIEELLKTIDIKILGGIGTGVGKCVATRVSH
jgi:hypothetical protein